MLENYLPVLIFMGIASILGCGLLIVGYLLSPKKPDSEKLSSYECGFEPFEDSRIQFDVRYYLVAILFIIFDLEIAFMVPWALALDDLPNNIGLWVMIIFMIELLVGFAYLWRKGALEWD